MNRRLLVIALSTFLHACAGTSNQPAAYSNHYAVESTNPQVTKNRDKSFMEQLNLGARRRENWDAAPRLVSYVFPVTPPAAIDKKIGGQVVVRVAVDKAGNVSDVDVTKSDHSLLSEAVVLAAKQWKFLPMTAGGVPTDFTVEQTFLFKAR